MDAPQRLDMQLVEQATAPKETSTDKIRRALDIIAGKYNADGNGHDGEPLEEPRKPGE